MRRFAWVLFLLALLPSRAPAQVKDDLGFFEGEPLGLQVKTFLLALGPDATMNCYAAWDPGTGEALVIDPGVPAPEVAEFIRASELKVLAVLHTHGHTDHVGGVEYLAEHHPQRMCDS